MKILAIGDEHFENKNEIETTLMCNKIYEIVLKESPDIIVSLGDAVHTHEIIHMAPFKRVIGFFHKLSQMVKHLYILVGNHDRPNNTVFLTEDSPFLACKAWPNTTIVDQVVVQDNLVFVPYVQIGRFMEALATKNITDENISQYDIIFAHQEFRGSRMGAIVSTEGDIWPSDYPMCISGHIHDFQELQPNMIYPGTPIQLGYGAPVKGVMLIEVKDRQIKYDFIDLNLPKKIIVNVTPEELVNYRVPENTFVRLVCKGDSKVIRELTKLDSVKEIMNNPKVKLSIQEEKVKSKNTVHSETKVTMPFQRRLGKTIESQNDSIKNLFESLFGKM